MSSIFITSIEGSGTYAVPSNETELTAATAGLDALLNVVPGFTYFRLLAWVETIGDGSYRTLNALIEFFEYGGGLCPDATEVLALGAALEAALLADPLITGIGDVQIHIVDAGEVPDGVKNLDGGRPDENYGGVGMSPLDGGSPSSF